MQVQLLQVGFLLIKMPFGSGILELLIARNSCKSRLHCWFHLRVNQTRAVFHTICFCVLLCYQSVPMEYSVILLYYTSTTYILFLYILHASSPIVFLFLLFSVPALDFVDLFTRPQSYFQSLIFLNRCLPLIPLLLFTLLFWT